MDLEIDKMIVADSSSDKKGSLHILYKIKGKIFASNAHVGAFMRSCLQKRVVKFPEDHRTWCSSSICASTPQPTVSYVGVHEKHEQRTKASQRTGIQLQKLVGLDGTALTTRQKSWRLANPTEAREVHDSKALSLSADYNPDIKDKLVEFAEQVAPVRGISYMPAFRVWVINLHKKDCVFKKERHGKNTNYMVVNEGDHITPDHTYHLRCWSQKYECCKGAKTDKMPLPKDLARLMKAQNEFMIYPSVSTISSNSR